LILWLIPLLTASVEVEVLSRFAPRSVEVLQGHRWITVRAGDPLPRQFHNPRLRLPGRLERAYPGTLILETRGGRLRLVNRVSEDEYVSGVLAAEGQAASDPALEALAVAARSMIRFLRGRHPGVDLCDLTHCQAYAGLASSPAIERAVGATAGRLLLFQGEAALAPYHSTCGGATIPPGNLFTRTAPYLEGVEDQGLCRRSPHFRWEVSLTPEEVSRIGDPSEPALAPGGASRLSRESFYRRAGRLLGWNVVKSADFMVEHQSGRFLLRGRGLGHRVGLCQWGAEALAALGKSAEEILAFYFPGCTVGPASALRASARPRRSLGEGGP